MKIIGAVLLALALTLATPMSANAHSTQPHKTACWLEVWTGYNFTGNSFVDNVNGQWINDADFGIHSVHSLRNGPCPGNAHIATRQYGGGNWWPGYTGPYASSGNVTGNYSGSMYEP
jgi:hypothetical protein